ncbi:MAG TPA: hypothetical protein VGX25_04055 [Actinophytocola sp.]|uniref:hypothetical protein n=1 Tax=Actinophytocola sp. TaxID=1872138 RepID=UPI002DDD5FFB|nr:hypothetical protein [Actinophytocola sp.]HEV2778552.1 hypothetical protein [Actinophytocola sp.]
MSLSEETRIWAARTLGMKEAEIVAVGELPGAGTVIETHDGQRTLVAADGSLSPYAGPVPDRPVDVDLDEEGLVDGDEVPEGSADVVLAWVGTDPARARRALEAEQAGQQRTTLIAKLEKLAQA